MKHRTRLSFSDIIVCASIAVFAAVSLFFMTRSHGDTVEIKTKDSVFTYSLHEDMTKVIHSSGYTLTIEIKDGCAHITSSDCPDKVCERSGSTNDPSKPIVCAPAEVILRIKSTGGNRENADFIAGR